VRSQTERRLTTADGAIVGEHLLQVFYPYLRETVEVFQVERVFARLNRFMRLMHERFGVSAEDRERRIDVTFEAQHRPREVGTIDEPLKSAFPVRRSMVTAPARPLSVDRRSETEILERFQRLKKLDATLPIEWQLRDTPTSLVGTLIGQRRQPFTLLLHSIQGVLNVRCVSPVGRVDPREFELVAKQADALPVRIGAVFDKRFEQYDLTAEGDILLGSLDSDLPRTKWLVETVTTAADRLEEVLLEIDADPECFHDDLQREADFER
jgi:hypothetical protein